MKALKVFFVIFGIFALYSCSTTIHNKIEPNVIEKPNLAVQSNKIPYTATVFIDAKQTTKYTKYDHDIMAVNVEYEFPTGAFLYQAAKYYLPKSFDKVYFYRNPLELLPKNSVLLKLSVPSIYVKEAPGFSNISLEVSSVVNAYIYYDSYSISPPITQNATAKTKISGFFSYLKNKDYASVASKSIVESLINIMPKINNAILNPAQSISYAKKKIEKEPLDHSTYVILANASLMANNTKDAISASKMLIALKDPLGYELLAKAYAKNNQFGLASSILKEALKKQIPNAAQNYLNFLLDTGDINSVMAYLKQNKVTMDVNTVASMYLGNKQYAQLIGFLNNYVNKKFTYTSIGIYLEPYLSESGYPIISAIESTSDALKYLKVGDEIVELNGHSTKNLNPNNFLANKDVNDIAIKTASQPQHFSIKRKPIIINEAAPEIAYISFAYYLNDNKEDFAKNAEFAYKLNPQSNAAICAKALKLIHEQRYDEALTLLNKADGVEFAKLLRAVIFAKLNKQDQAITLYNSIKRQSILAKSFDLLFMNNIEPFIQSKLKEAQYYLNSGDYRKTIDSYALILNISDQMEIYSKVSQIIARYPSIVELNEQAKKQLIYAQMYYQENKIDNALNELNNLVSRYPFNPRLHYDLALLLAQAQDYKKAIKHMNAYLMLLPDAPDKEAVRNEIYKWEFKLKED